jgi:hypothetical protein
VANYNQKLKTIEYKTSTSTEAPQDKMIAGLNQQR